MMKYRLVKDMIFYDDGNKLRLKKGSVFAELAKNKMTRDLHYRKSKFEKREDCKAVILVARKKWRFFKLGIDVIKIF